jgi:hypothetical protein
MEGSACFPTPESQSTGFYGYKPLGGEMKMPKSW